MSLQETLNSALFEVAAGAPDAAAHQYIGVVDASVAMLRQMMGMSAEQYTAWVDGKESPAGYVPEAENEQAVGASDLVAKNGEAVQLTQADLAAHRANLAQDVADAEASFGRLTSRVPAFDALPPQTPQPPVDNPYMWN